MTVQRLVSLLNNKTMGICKYELKCGIKQNFQKTFCTEKSKLLFKIFKCMNILIMHRR